LLVVGILGAVSSNRGILVSNGSMGGTMAAIAARLGSRLFTLDKLQVLLDHLRRTPLDGSACPSPDGDATRLRSGVRADGSLTTIPPCQLGPASSPQGVRKTFVNAQRQPTTLNGICAGQRLVARITAGQGSDRNRTRRIDRLIRLKAADLRRCVYR